MSDNIGDEFEIERIIGHYVNSENYIYYNIKWKGYPEDQATYEPLDSFSRESRHLALAYKRKHHLEHVEDIVSYDDESDEDRESANAQPLRVVLEQIRIMTHMYHTDRYGLMAEAYPGKRNVPKGVDKLYVHGWHHHFFVYLFLPGHKFSIVLDGSNGAFGSRLMLEELRKITGRKLKPMFFGTQTRDNRCGSSAVAICVALISRYRRMDYFNISKLEISFHSGYRNLVNRLHPHQHELLADHRRTVDQLNVRFECNFCTKKYRSYHQQVVHEYMAHRRER